MFFELFGHFFLDGSVREAHLYGVCSRGAPGIAEGANQPKCAWFVASKFHQWWKSMELSISSGAIVNGGCSTAFQVLWMLLKHQRCRCCWPIVAYMVLVVRIWFWEVILDVFVDVFTGVFCTDLMFCQVFHDRCGTTVRFNASFVVWHLRAEFGSLQSNIWIKSHGNQARLAGKSPITGYVRGNIIKRKEGMSQSHTCQSLALYLW